ncbi:hypothetical protein F0U62_24445 [Cystobacter fuscus]|nr:hypothetical protein F0U62_24445 [Cystobacter fuscus]
MPSVCPASGERGRTRGHRVGWDGMTNQRRIKAIAGNSASCLGFSIALLTGSIPATSVRWQSARRDLASWRVEARRQPAEPPPVPRCAATARFDLSAGSPEVAPEVCASADEPTAFVFDSLARGSCVSKRAVKGRAGAGVP